MEHRRPRYPIYVPSKGRAHACQTVKFLLRDQCPFALVVEPQEEERYASAFPTALRLVLPWNNGGLLAARNWIKDHATAAGYARHWQLDDNMTGILRWWRGKRLHCGAGVALAITEDFVDRYENIAVAGLNYKWLAHHNGRQPHEPFWLNVHVYSCSLILNALPYGWRLRYNDDTDICLRVLADGWCTVSMNAFIVDKLTTMTVMGGNTTDLYQGDGRLKMARTLERMWPGVVTTKRRFKRPQHVIKNQWRGFDTPLKLKPGLTLDDFAPNDYGLRLTQVKPIKSPELHAFVKASGLLSPLAE
jgi:hypothetical protein